MSYTREQIEAAVKSKGYVWFADDANKGYDVNIVGVRNSSTGTKVTNVFDDNLTLSFKDETGAWQFYSWMNTTDPGKKSMLEWKKMGIIPISAAESQSLIHLKNEYCDKRRCLSCSIGHAILRGNT